ncbi:uncharacterized protein N7484_001382 [Penicillium longicatenatum]|uniref:uncharacterized protein n=1 Tax=Penicillium longicatenatum TaxID=1561947 RepID=UPI002549A4B6|nr:uncharacterized protein N7484_001382 [Penicillium longicatenatum]KAJ5657733.1 hypothetical protein N7484_001382 [Penicillium longicatenatum]
MSNLKSTLLSKAWFGFDLDDTLHEFRKASTQASQSVFEAIHFNEGISIDILRSTYQDILRTTTANAFTDGRTSVEYRRERLTRLLEVVDGNKVYSTSMSEIEPLLDIYQSSLRSHLALKPGVVDLFRVLRGLEKNIIVITEGPADAQQWTVKELGLEPYIDILVTTNEVGTSKVDGLFGVVLGKYGIDAGDIVYFGDNAVRDVQAAGETGILAVLYDEGRNKVLDNLDTLRIDSWRMLLDILGDGR